MPCSLSGWLQRLQPQKLSEKVQSHRHKSHRKIQPMPIQKQETAHCRVHAPFDFAGLDEVEGAVEGGAKLEAPLGGAATSSSTHWLPVSDMEDAPRICNCLAVL